MMQISAFQPLTMAPLRLMADAALALRPGALPVPAKGTAAQRYKKGSRP